MIFGFDSHDEKLKVLLFKRQIEPDQGKWSLIGSFIEPDESGTSAAKRILKSFTGIEIGYLEQFRTYSSVDRDPGDRVISIAYFSLISIDKLSESPVSDFESQWFPIEDLPVLAIDHDKIINDALHMVQEQSRVYPLGINLLPDKFTLPELLRIYQQIYQAPVDDRNFRRKIQQAGFLTKLDEKDMSDSKKGAFLYQFDTKRYLELVKSGYSFDFV